MMPSKVSVKNKDQRFDRTLCRRCSTEPTQWLIEKSSFLSTTNIYQRAGHEFRTPSFCIETTHSKDRMLLNELTNNLGGVAHEFNSEKRALIHLIAVLINNFGNHLLHLGSELSKKHNIPFHIFSLLIKQTYQKALDNGPENSQTGPALRRDQKTIEKHIDLITDDNLKKLYLNLTTSIQKKHER